MGPGDAGAGADLDALIGEIRREAARRRAAPDFPIDEEARRGAELDGLAPVPGGADLAALTAALRHPATSPQDAAGLTASAVAALSVRLAELERHRPGPPAGGPAAGAGGAPDLAVLWAAELATGSGAVMVAGPDAAVWVPALGAGAQVHGVEPTAAAYADDGPVRSGGLLDHLRNVGSGSLALTIVVGALAGPDAERLDAVAVELARTSARVAVCCEAPWAWRRRVGDAAADTAPDRPVGPEAWLAALDRAGRPASARYSDGGGTYLLTCSTP